MSKQKMLITTEQYYSLTSIGREIHEYWMKWKPEMYRELHQMGELWKVLSSEDERLDEMIIDLINKGLSEDMAKEVARAEIYDEMAD